MLPPQVTKPNQKKISQCAGQMILPPKLLNLDGFLFDNLGVELFLLDENTIAVETNEFLVRGS